LWTPVLSAGLTTGEASSLQDIQCRITIMDTLLSDDGTKRTNSDSVVCIPLLDGEEGHTMLTYDISLPSTTRRKFRSAIHAGQLYLTVTQARFDGDSIATTDHSKFTVLERDDKGRRLDHKPFNQTKGSRSLAIVTVSTTKGQRVSYGRHKLKKHLFYDSNSMAAQYQRCSLGQLHWTFGGYYNVVLEGDISDYDSPAHARNTALQKLVTEGVVQESAQELADNVMLILPKGTRGMIANAGVNYWLSTFNDVWSLDLLTVSHELGKCFNVTEIFRFR
jgi:hypothetical protein